MEMSQVQFSPGATQLLLEQCGERILFKSLGEAQRIMDAEYPGLKVSLNSNGETLISKKTVV